MVNWSFCQFQGSPRLPRVTQGLPKVTQSYQRLPKVACISMRLKAFNELAWSSKSRNAVPWICMQLHKLTCSRKRCMQLHEHACCSLSLHEVPRACMQFHEPVCSFFLCLSSSQEFRSACSWGNTDAQGTWQVWARSPYTKQIQFPKSALKMAFVWHDGSQDPPPSPWADIYHQTIFFGKSSLKKNRWNFPFFIVEDFEKEF